VIERTHAEFHAQPQIESVPAHSAAVSQEVTLVLCVHDDIKIRKSLQYLREMACNGFRVLCLFTRYARLQDVIRARDYGFVNYRWDGTLENGKLIARSIYGRHWIVILNPGEKIVGDSTTLLNFLESQPPEIAEVSVSCVDNRMEPRLFHVRPPGEVVRQTQCTEVFIC
jgi:hypothetical protein